MALAVQGPPYTGRLTSALTLTKVALVGPNGAGKYTLLELMVSDLTPTDGLVRWHNHLRIAHHQHRAEKLDLEESPLHYMMREYGKRGSSRGALTSAIGRFWLTGKAAGDAHEELVRWAEKPSDLCVACMEKPHMLLLDEPTNHLDIESIDSLAAALNEWDGGMVLVSHDFRLISQAAEEIWVYKNKKVTQWEGDILSFKMHLR